MHSGRVKGEGEQVGRLGKMVVQFADATPIDAPAKKSEEAVWSPLSHLAAELAEINDAL